MNTGDGAAEDEVIQNKGQALGSLYLCQFPNVAFSKQLPEENESHYITIKNNFF